MRTKEEIIEKLNELKEALIVSHEKANAPTATIIDVIKDSKLREETEIALAVIEWMLGELDEI